MSKFLARHKNMARQESSGPKIRIFNTYQDTKVYFDNNFQAHDLDFNLLRGATYGNKAHTHSMQRRFALPPRSLPGYSVRSAEPLHTRVRHKDAGVKLASQTLRYGLS